MDASDPREYLQRETNSMLKTVLQVGPWETLGEVQEDTALGPKDFPRNNQESIHGSQESLCIFNTYLAGPPASVLIYAHLFLP